MSASPKVKVSITIDAGVLGVVDGQAATEGTTRSAVMERLLRQISRANLVTRLEEDTAAYYDKLTGAETRDDASWAAASSRAARGLRIDEASPEWKTKAHGSQRSRRRARG